MKKIFIHIIFILGLLGCGGGSGGSSTPDTPGLNPDSGESNMVMNQVYALSQGDEIIKTSPITRIRVTHIDGSRGSSVELIEGSATLKIN